MPPGSLPRPLTRLFGREDDTRAVLESLHVHRLVTLAGPGGVGKTRLSIEIARAVAARFPDGARFVDLSAIREGDRLPVTIRSALGAGESQGDALSSVIEVIGDRDLLLLLDNCEQVIDAGATVVQRLLEACPNLRVLATSREPLRVPGEAVHRLAPLALPAASAAFTVESLAQSPAVNLFVDRARLGNPGFALRPENVNAIVAICNAVDGLPLATELAAARMRTLPVEQLAARLRERLPMLTGGARTAPERQRTVEAAVRWSYELLDGSEKTLFRRLAVFSGGWTLEAAEGICAFGDLAEPDVLPLLEELVDRSLVVASPGGDGRFRFLEVIHEFARNELLASGEATAAGAGHCRWFSELSQRAEPHLDTWSAGYWFDLLEADVDNLWAAIRWSLGDPLAHDAGLRMTGSLMFFWNARGHLADGYEATRALLAAAQEARPSARLAALISLMWSSQFLMLYDESETLSLEAAAIARELVDDRSLAHVLWRRAHNRLGSGDIAGARTPIEEAVAVARRGAPRIALCNALFTLELVERSSGNDEAGASALEEALIIACEAGSPRLEMLLTGSRAERALATGDLAEARRGWERARDLAPGVGILRLTSGATLALAAIAIEGRDFPAAVNGLRQLFSTRGAVEGEVGVFAVLLAGAVEAELGEAARAARWLASLEGTRVHLDPPDRRMIDAALRRCRERLGARFAAAYALGERTPPRALWPEIAAVLANMTVPTPHGAPSPLAGLSPREVEILRLVAGGGTNQEIADALVLSRRTVETHIANAYAKIGAHGRVEAVRFAVDNGLAGTPPA